ncbi:MAG: ATP-binding cassette domain-containing protein [Gammaproteobacteria bacterium]|nr:ATP-binding cassette domain-containing protein [Gammaproteobacteria bacterium]
MASLTLKQLVSPGLHPIDLHIQAGECLTLSGPSGCGKTRLLRAIADLDPHTGEALAGEMLQSQTPVTDWRAQVTLLPTETHWWADHVADHFKQFSDCIKRLGFSQESMEWETLRLSSGEKQRLGVARTLEHQPKVLLLDEPTANLDPDNTQRVEAIIYDYRKNLGAAVLWVCHNPEQRQRVGDRGVVIKQGELEIEPWS